MIVYDLGLSDLSKKQLSNWKNVQLETFPFEDLPPHFRQLKQTYSFKPWGLWKTLQEHEYTLWIDANMELRRPLDEVRYILATKGHFFTIQRPLFPNTRFHSPQVVQSLGCHAPIHSCHQVPAGLQGYRLGSQAYHQVLEPLVQCARVQECIAPKGTNRSNHRQDQTVLNAILCALDWQDIQTDPKWWLSTHIDDEHEDLQPTKDPHEWNSMVIYTRRDHPYKPYRRDLDSRRFKT